MQVNLFRRGEFARALGVSETTVNRWLADGKIAFVRLPGGERRIPATELQRILEPLSSEPELADGLMDRLPEAGTDGNDA